jgi:hypothetical protein
MPRTIRHTPGEIEEAEALLCGLIAECGAMIREQIRPAITSEEDVYRKGHLVSDAVRLMQTGGGLAEAIAHLRGYPAPEQRQRITVERLITGTPVLSLPNGEGGRLASVGERSELTEAGAPRTQARKRRSEGWGG